MDDQTELASIGAGGPPDGEQFPPAKRGDSALEEFKQLQAIITRY